jgi:ribosomal protein S18 acetylase RimI-like enzyme
MRSATPVLREEGEREGVRRLPARLWEASDALSHFTLVADLTTLRPDCRVLSEAGTLVARYDGLPFAALAFLGDDPAAVARLAGRLVDPAEPFYVLVNEVQADVATRAFRVVERTPEGQMLFSGDAAALDPGDAVRLAPVHREAMRDLATQAGLQALEADPFRYGPAYGVWADDQLIAMAATHLTFPGAAEIGNVATRPGYRRRGHARNVVAALTSAHLARGRRVFLMVFETNRAAQRLYQGLGFTHRRRMFLLRCTIRESSGVSV